MKLIALSFLIVLVYTNIAAQCDSGNEPECTCETADVLCKVTELNRYSGEMSEFQHPQDGFLSFVDLCQLLTIRLGLVSWPGVKR